MKVAQVTEPVGCPGFSARDVGTADVPDIDVPLRLLRQQERMIALTSRTLTVERHASRTLCIRSELLCAG